MDGFNFAIKRDGKYITTYADQGGNILIDVSGYDVEKDIDLFLLDIGILRHMIMVKV